MGVACCSLTLAQPLSATHHYNSRHTLPEYFTLWLKYVWHCYVQPSQQHPPLPKYFQLSHLRLSKTGIIQSWQDQSCQLAFGRLPLQIVVFNFSFGFQPGIHWHQNLLSALVFLLLHQNFYQQSFVFNFCRLLLPVLFEGYLFLLGWGVPHCEKPQCLPL